MITDHLFAKIVGYHTFAGGPWLGNGRTAMNEIGVPKQDIAFLGFKGFGFEWVLGEDLLYLVFKSFIRHFSQAPAGMT